MRNDRILPWYYAGTALFVLLDYVFSINVRVAFLEDWPAARVTYYGFCFACLALIMRRPAWSTLIGTIESLVTLVALILGMAVRVIVPNDAIFSENVPIVTTQEIVNFLISGSMAYYAWITGTRRLFGR